MYARMHDHREFAKHHKISCAIETVLKELEMHVLSWPKQLDQLALMETISGIRCEI